MGKKTPREEAEAFAKRAPTLRPEELQEANELFPAYLFRRRRKGGDELWCTCCGTHKVLTTPYTDAEFEAATYPHAREEKASKRWGWTVDQGYIPPNIRCPYCDASVRVKELRYTGRRDNLWTYRRAVVLRQWRGDLWACAYSFDKSYRDIERLTDKPAAVLMGAYRFREGRVDYVSRGWWYTEPFDSLRTEEKPRLWKGPRVHDPYTCTSELGTSYDIIGLREMEKSFLRYCYYSGATKNIAIHYAGDLIEYLTACSFYPRKIEMLQKAGLYEVVHDFAIRGVKNAALVRWETDDPKQFLRLSRAELEQYKNGSCDLEALRTYAELRPTAGRSDLGDIYDLWLNVTQTAHKKLLTASMKRWGVSAGKLLRYLREQAGTGRVCATVQMFVDYLKTAEALGYDMENPVIHMPKNLQSKHDSTTAAWAALQNEENERPFRENRLPKLEKKYCYSDGTFLIRPAANGAEIKREGELLKHCVGGYADRHIRGETTILFLRRCDQPGRPLATIEVGGSTVRQVHGWKNEREACGDNPEKKSCWELYGDILVPWLDWVKRGSPRQADGTPKLRRREEKEKAV